MSPVVAARSEKSRLSVLLEHLSTIDDPRDVRRILHPLAEISVPGRLRHDRGLRRLRRYRRLGRGASRFPSAASALFTRCAWRALAHDPDESSGARSCFRPRSPRGSVRPRPTVRSSSPSMARRPGVATIALHITGEAPLHLVSAFATTSRLVLGQGGGGGQIERTDRHSDFAGTTGRRGPAAWRAGFHRCHRDQSRHRRSDTESWRRLSAGREAPISPASARRSRPASTPLRRVPSIRTPNMTRVKVAASNSATSM